ncbi:MAG: helix-turn-helix domain-containing protein [Sorangiineae bacterium]|nr:helix-turn-helix domain-containing protein [Polyangiaceae bacterium]MEB2322785.1 helix-turn-helix domain-containing protein [Sorangiineae bacterium]
MTIKPIRTEEDYDAALQAIEDAWGAEPGSAKADRLEVMALLVRQYEEQHHPVPPPDPIDAIKFRLDQLGLDPSALEDVIGVGRGRVSEILNRRRALNLKMIRKLNERLQIAPSVLIAEYALKKPGGLRDDDSKQRH